MKYPARSFAITSRRFSSRIATNPKVSVRSRSSCLAGCRSHRIRNAIKFLADPRLDLLTPLYLIGHTTQCCRHDNYRLSYNSCGLHDLLPTRSGTSLASSSIVVSQIARFCMPGQLSLTDCRNRIRATSTNICTLLHAPAMLEVFGDRPYWEPHPRSSLRFHRWPVFKHAAACMRLYLCQPRKQFATGGPKSTGKLDS